MTNKACPLKTLAMVKSEALQQLSIVDDAIVLDVDLIIAKVCQLSRSACYAFPERLISEVEYQQIHHWVSRRATGEPLAYLFQEKEFWSLLLEVNSSTLVPRPETECLVEWVLNNYPKDSTLRVADLGTGSGAIAIALASERPLWQIDAIDCSAQALDVVQRNIHRHHCDHVTCYQGHWCDALPDTAYDLIVSNPPYIDASDPHLKDLLHEPQSALVAGEAGLSDIAEIVQQATMHLLPGGCCVVEHGSSQAGAVMHLMEEAKYAKIKGYSDFSGLDRFVVGKL